MSSVTAPRIVPASERNLHNRVSLRQTVANSFTMAYRGLVKVRRTPEQLLDVTLQPIIFTLMFTYLFGGALAGSVGAYVAYLIPGLVVQTVITGSVTTGVQLREDMEKGVFDRFKSMPIARISPLAGALMADTVRYAIATFITFVMGIIIGWRPGGGPVALVLDGLLVIICAWSLSWIFAFFGVIARTASSVQGISFLVLFPLTFLSNIFVKTTHMPDWLKWFVNHNPVSFLVQASRSITNDGTAPIQLLWALIGCAIIVAIFAPLTVRAYMRKA